MGGNAHRSAPECVAHFEFMTAEIMKFVLLHFFKVKLCRETDLILCVHLN